MASQPQEKPVIGPAEDTGAGAFNSAAEWYSGLSPEAAAIVIGKEALRLATDLDMVLLYEKRDAGYHLWADLRDDLAARIKKNLMPLLSVPNLFRQERTMALLGAMNTYLERLDFMVDHLEEAATRNSFLASDPRRADLADWAYTVLDHAIDGGFHHPGSGMQRGMWNDRANMFFSRRCAMTGVDPFPKPPAWM